MDEKLTVEQVIKLTADMLSGIRVPVLLAEEIGVPVSHSIRNLLECSRVLEEARVAAEIQNEKPEEPEEGKDNG